MGVELKESNTKRVGLIADNDKIREEIGGELTRLKQELEGDSRALEDAR